MIDTLDAQLAFRARCEALVIATTGATYLAATATGYTRADGSFLDDGFESGMEIVPATFVTNTVGVIATVTDTEIVTFGARTSEAEGAERSIVAGLPTSRAWENENFTGTTNTPYVEEDFLMQPSGLQSFPAHGGSLLETGLYVLKWYGLSGVGVRGLRRSVAGLLARFTPGTVITVGDASLRVRGSLTESGPYAGQMIRVDGGWTAIAVTIPWRAESINAVVS